MNSVCSHERLQLALAGLLNSDDESTLHLHLEECESCAAEMERLSGGEHAIHEIATMLIPDDLDDAVPLREECSTADFVVDHLEPSDDPAVLGRLGGYDVLEVIGRGGMGVVLKGFDCELKRFVAIKALAPHLAHSALARKRFAREAQAAAAVVNLHVIAIHQVQPNGQLPFLVMPLLTGESLAQRLAARGTLELNEVLRIGMQAAEGLAAAHGQGLIHRDVKPANILLEKGVERAVLTDFGLARAADDVSMTRWGIIAGTPEYMSPEQARGAALDGRSDLFSLGCVLYQMATGVSPFRADSTMATLRRIVDEQPAAMASLGPDLPPWFIEIVERLLSKDPAQRFASASEVSKLLEACLSHLQQPASVPLPASLQSHAGGRPSIFNSRRKEMIPMCGAIGISLLAMFFWQPTDPAPEKDTDASAAKQPAATLPAADELQPMEAVPKRLHHFADLTKGHDAKLAISPDGKLIALANGNPMITIETPTKSSVADNWKSIVDILNSETGKVIVSLKLTTPEEEAVLAATDRVTHVEATDLAFSPDATVIAVGTNIGQVKLFKAHTGELVRTLDDALAKLADKETPANWMSLKRAIGSVTSLEFSPDGSQLAVSGGSFADFAEGFSKVTRLGFRTTGPGRLKLWDVKAGSLKHDLVGHNDSAFAVAFSPDGKLLASAGRWNDKGDLFGNGVLIWNPQTGEQVHRLIRSTADAGVQSIVFSPDSKMLALGSQRFGDDDDKPSTGGVSLVHASSGIEEWLVTVPGWAKPLSFAADGKHLMVLCGGQSIRFLDSGTGATKHEIRPETKPEFKWIDLSLAPRSGLLAITGVDKDRNGSVEIWSTPTTKAPATTAQGKEAKAKPLATRNFITETKVRIVAGSEDGKLIAFANGSPAFTGVKAKVNLEKNWKPTAETVDAETGKTVAKLQLTAPEEGAVFATAEHFTHLEVTALAITADGSVVAVGTNVGQVKLFDGRTGKLIRSLDDTPAKQADKQTPDNWKSLQRAMGSVASLAFSPDGSRLAMCGTSFGDYSRAFPPGNQDELTTGSGRLKVWDVKKGTLKRDLAGHSHANAVAFSSDGSTLASSGRWRMGEQPGTGVILWNTQTGTQLRTIPTEANGRAHWVNFSPDGKQIATISLHFDVDQTEDAIKSTVSLTNVATGVAKWRRTFTGAAKPATFYSKTVLVLIGGQMLRFFDQEDGSTLAAIKRSADPHDGARWNDLALVKKNSMWITAGETRDRQGTLEIMDPDRPDATRQK